MAKRSAKQLTANALNLFRTPVWNAARGEWARPLNLKFLRVCSVRRLLARGIIRKARALELLAQRHTAKEMKPLTGAVDLWIAHDRPARAIGRRAA